MKLIDEQIKDIADYLDMGMCCFYHLNKGELEVIPDFDNSLSFDLEREPWQESLDKLDEDYENYFKFEKMTSHESFTIMADFAENVEDKHLQETLLEALNRSKPFRNFKWQIDNSGEYRQKWFDFKNQRLIDFVKFQIEAYNQKNKEE